MPLHILASTKGAVADRVCDSRPRAVGEVWTWASIDMMPAFPLQVTETPPSFRKFGSRTRASRG